MKREQVSRVAVGFPEPKGAAPGPFSDFLRDVLFEQPFDPTKVDVDQGMAILDFRNDIDLDLTELDYGLLDHWSVDGAAGHGGQAQWSNRSVEKMRHSLVSAYTDSSWRWDPQSQDSGYTEQGNLPVPGSDQLRAQLQQTRQGMPRLVQDALTSAARDEVLSMVLSTCRQKATASRIQSSFPPTDILDTLMQIYFTSHDNQVSSCIHFPTLQLRDQWPEWVAITAAAGAIRTGIPTLKKFGYALQEAVRKQLIVRPVRRAERLMMCCL